MVLKQKEGERDVLPFFRSSGDSSYVVDESVFSTTTEGVREGYYYFFEAMKTHLVLSMMDLNQAF